RHASLERRLTTEEQVGGDETAVAPTHHADALGVHVWQRLEEVRRGEHVVHFLGAVIDRVVQLRTVARAATVLGRYHDVTLGHRLLDERQVVRRPVAMNSTVYPDEGRMATVAPLLERRIDIDRNF